MKKELLIKYIQYNSFDCDAVQLQLSKLVNL